MDILLRGNYSYKVSDSYEESKKKIEGLLNNKWYDLSKEYYGTVNDDGSFTFKQKIIFFNLFKYGQTIYCRGKLIDNDKGTTIELTLAPNLIFVIIIFCSLIVLLNIFFGDNSFIDKSNGKLINTFIVILLNLVIILITQISIYFKKRRFEKVVIERVFKQFKTKINFDNTSI